MNSNGPLLYLQNKFEGFKNVSDLKVSTLRKSNWTQKRPRQQNWNIMSDNYVMLLRPDSLYYPKVALTFWWEKIFYISRAKISNTFICLIVLSVVSFLRNKGCLRIILTARVREKYYSTVPWFEPRIPAFNILFTRSSTTRQNPCSKYWMQHTIQHIQFNDCFSSSNWQYGMTCL